MKQVFIADLAVFLPERLVTNDEIESQIQLNGEEFQKGMLKRLFGCEERYFADEQTQVSDLAAMAGDLILNRTNDPIDLLIFAAASSDLIEPATANIIQQKMGIICPVMDVKNACNSLVTAIEVASAFVSSGMHRNVLIVNGEKLSEVINFHPRNNEHLLECLSGYSLGDAGSAVLINDKGGSPIHFQKSISWGSHWELCTVAGGGSRAFRNPESYFFEGKTAGLRNVFLEKALPFIIEQMNESDWEITDIDCLITHQVSKSSTDKIASSIGIPIEKCMNTFEYYGNTAAAAIPLALNRAVSENRIKKGDK